MPFYSLRRSLKFLSLLRRKKRKPLKMPGSGIVKPLAGRTLGRMEIKTAAKAIHVSD
jgi:hypothetical protein